MGQLTGALAENSYSSKHLYDLVLTCVFPLPAFGDHVIKADDLL
jgi:hypothetical protein